MKEKFYFVYLTTNLVNRKQYVGDHSTRNIDDEYLGSGVYFKNALKEYGKENFKREIIEVFHTKEEAFIAQEKYINEYNTLVPNGYNISPKGGSKYVGSCSLETREKIRKSMRGVNVGKKHSEKQNKEHSIRMRGKKHTDITKQKISKSNSGKIITEEHRKNLSLAQRGKKRKPLSEEHKQKISESETGRIQSEETKLKISNSNHGKIRTKETKEKIRLSLIGRNQSEETKNKKRISSIGKLRTEETKEKMRKPKSEEHKANIRKNHWRNKNKDI